MEERMRYKWEITERKSGKIIAEPLADFPTYESAKEDMISWISVLNRRELNRKDCVEYNYTIYDIYKVR